MFFDFQWIGLDQMIGLIAASVGPLWFPPKGK